MEQHRVRIVKVVVNVNSAMVPDFATIARVPAIVINVKVLALARNARERVKDWSSNVPIVMEVVDASVLEVGAIIVKDPVCAVNV